MQEERGEEPPVFAPSDNGRGLQPAEPLERERLVEPPSTISTMNIATFKMIKAQTAGVTATRRRGPDFLHRFSVTRWARAFRRYRRAALSGTLGRDADLLSAAGRVARFLAQPEPRAGGIAPARRPLSGREPILLPSTGIRRSQPPVA